MNKSIDPYSKQHHQQDIRPKKRTVNKQVLHHGAVTQNKILDIKSSVIHRHCPRGPCNADAA